MRRTATPSAKIGVIGTPCDLVCGLWHSEPACHRPSDRADHALTYAAARLHSARASGDAEDRVLHLWDPTNQIEQIDTGGLT